MKSPPADPALGTNLSRRACATPGCPNLTTEGKCPDCRKAVSQDRGSARDRGYDVAWEKVRLMKLRRDPRCELKVICKGMIPDDAAKEVHHLLPLRDYPALRLVIKNLASTCRDCHQEVTRREGVAEGNGVPLPAAIVERTAEVHREFIQSLLV